MVNTCRYQINSLMQVSRARITSVVPAQVYLLIWVRLKLCWSAGNGSTNSVESIFTCPPPWRKHDNDDGRIYYQIRLPKRQEASWSRDNFHYWSRNKLQLKSSTNEAFPDRGPLRRPLNRIKFPLHQLRWSHRKGWTGTLFHFVPRIMSNEQFR